MFVVMNELDAADARLQISYNLSEIAVIANKLWQYAHGRRIICFSGGMGTGKTTLIHALCKQLGVTDAVSSPTFALVNEYHFDHAGAEQIIYHMDWYRVKDVTEALQSGLEDTLSDGAAYCFVEWPERAASLIPDDALWIRLEATGEQERSLTAGKQVA
jgi:tRNA threonylcarbamoyladenosine biosynthesis protein TsaE